MKYEVARTIAHQELQVQQALAEKGLDQVLHIPLLLGATGIGKTAMARELASMMGLDVVLAINCGENSDPTDIVGVPDIVRPAVQTFLGNPDDLFCTEWSPNRFAAMACDAPVLLLFDDIDKATKAVRAGLLGVFANRMFRDRVIHKGTLIVAAGNRVDDDIDSDTLSESLLTRVTAIEVDPDPVRFCAWGTESGQIHPIVIGFLSSKPDALLGKSTDKSYRFATPRGWWEASQSMFVHSNPTESVGGGANWKRIVARKCGDAASNDF